MLTGKGIITTAQETLIRAFSKVPDANCRFRARSRLNSPGKASLSGQSGVSTPSLSSYATSRTLKPGCSWLTTRRTASEKDPGFDLYWLAVALKQVETFPNRIEDWEVNMLISLDVLGLKRTMGVLAEAIMEDIARSR